MTFLSKAFYPYSLFINLEMQIQINHQLEQQFEIWLNSLKMKSIDTTLE